MRQNIKPNRMTKRRAIGPVIVSVFMVSVLLLGFSIFQLIFYRTSIFSETVETSHQLTLEKEREELTVLGNPFNDSNKLYVTLVNEGEVETDVIWISVIDPSTGQPLYGYKNVDPPITLKPEEISEPIEGDEAWTFPGGSKGETRYIIQAITTRGTTMSYHYPNPERQPIKGETDHLVIGPFIFDFTSESFTYTSASKSTPHPGYEIKDNEDKITFRVEITNHHNESMIINGYSYMLLVVPWQPTINFHETELDFFIVDNSSTPDSLVSYSPYNPLIVNPDQKVILKFASENPLDNDFNFNDCLQGRDPYDNNPGTENLVTTFLVLFWKYGDSGQVLGQTIPFVSIHLPEY
jgi:hypothetical protein